MEAPIARELRAHLGRLLNGSISLEIFRHWFANALWSLSDSVDDDTVDFVYLIENRIAEYSGDHIDDQQLLQTLRNDAAVHYGMTADPPIAAARTH